MIPQLEIHPDEEWAQAVAGRFAAFLADRPEARICLPTGRTMVAFYAEVARQADLSRSTIFLLDEFGGLPPGDPGRCLSMIHLDLLDQLDGRVPIRWPDVDAPDPPSAASRYQDLIDQGGLDLALVGLGGNGHIGMNEPGSSPDSPTRVVRLDPITSENAVMAYGATVRPTWGITVGLGGLLAAEELWLMVTGAHKAKILAKALNDPIGPELPATYLRLHRHARVLADQSAAGS